MTDTLRKLAEAATPGPWYPGHLGRSDHSCKCTGIVDEGYAGGIASVHVWNGIESIYAGGNDAPPEAEAAANMNFIAAANPTAVIALLDEIDALRAKVKAQAEALKPFAEAWNIHSGKGEVCRHLSLAELGVLASYHVSAVHFRRAAQEADNE